MKVTVHFLSPSLPPGLEPVEVGAPTLSAYISNLGGGGGGGGWCMKGRGGGCCCIIYEDCMFLYRAGGPE